MPDTLAFLTERKATHGEFGEFSDVSQRLKAVMQTAPNWARLNNSQREALEMIAHKQARILTGDPNFLDAWRDVIGYATRVYEWLEKRAGTTDVQSRHIVLNNGEWELP